MRYLQSFSRRSFKTKSFPSRNNICFIKCLIWKVYIVFTFDVEIKFCDFFGTFVDGCAGFFFEIMSYEGIVC